MKKFIICLSALLFVGCAKDSQGDDRPVQNQRLFPKHIVREYTYTKYENGASQSIDMVDESVLDVADNKVMGIVFKSYPKNDKDNPETIEQRTYTYENNLPKFSVEKDLKTNQVTEKTTYKFQNGKRVENIKETYGNNLTTTQVTSYKYDGGKLVEKQEKNGNEAPEITTYKYVSETQIVVEETSYVVYNGAIEPLKLTTLYTLDAQKRVTKSVQETQYSKTTTEYQYDDKNNYNHSDITFQNPEYFIIAEVAKNNVIYEKTTRESKNGGSTSMWIITYTYEYNDKGYPISIIEEEKVDNNSPKITTTKITY